MKKISIILSGLLLQVNLFAVTETTVESYMDSCCINDKDCSSVYAYTGENEENMCSAEGLSLYCCPGTPSCSTENYIPEDLERYYCSDEGTFLGNAPFPEALCCPTEEGCSEENYYPDLSVCLSYPEDYDPESITEEFLSGNYDLYESLKDKLLALLNKNNLSISNGGVIPDNEVLKDGIGVKVFGGDINSLDYRPINKILSSITSDTELAKETNPDTFIEDPDHCFGKPIGTYVGGNLIVDRDLLRSIILANGDYQHVCTSNVFDMKELFVSSDSTTEIVEVINIDKDITKWDTSNVKDFSFLFQYQSTFNQAIGNWDTSSATTLRYMFYRASAFNQPLNFNTSKVTDMSSMFNRAYAFNQPLNFDMSKVTNISYMFARNSSFNQDISSWDISNVTTLRAIFYYATSFNQDISSWNTSNVTNMSYLMYRNTAFNKNISNWDTSKVTDSTYFDYGADSWPDSYKPSF